MLKNMRQELIESSRKSHKEWFARFSNEEISLLVSIGSECGADNKFFKQEILNIYDALKNRKLKNIPYLYEQFVNRYLDLVPEHIRAQTDRSLLINDDYYRAWFFNRQMFIFHYLVAKDNFRKGKKHFSHLLWSPLLDNQAPESCYQFKDKVFHVDDDQFEKIAAQHWSKPQKGCRCCLISIAAEKANSYIKTKGK